MTPEYDVLVIGSGTGGYVAAIRAAQLGLRTALVEREPVLGGTCLNWGCIPTKALLEHAHALKLVTNAAEWGIDLGAGATRPAIDLLRVHARKDKIVTGLTKGVDFLLKKNKVVVIRGTARLAGRGRVDVSGHQARTVTAREIVVATGSAPRAISGLTVDRVHVITSDDAINLPKVPGSIAIIGSGAVGVEFASIFHQFGSTVTIVEMKPSLVPNEDESISAELAKIFSRRGINVRTSTSVGSAVLSDGRVALGLSGASGETSTLEVECVLVAAGRRPVTDGLGAGEAGLALDNGFIVVDNYYRTNVPGVSAIGDVIAIGGASHPQLAHVSSAEGTFVAERIAGKNPEPLNYDHVPFCTYCDPEVASVGLTERAARARGLDVRVGRFPFSALGRARIAGETDGFVKVVGDARYDELLGVHIIGPRATEIIAEGVTALRLEATVESLVHTMHAHPTMTEAIGEAAHATMGRAIHG